MNKAWLIVLALLIAATGCDQAKEAETALKDAKVDAKQATEAAKVAAKQIANPEAKTNVDGAEKTQTSAPLVARTVLNDAIADAKSDGKSLLVYSTADS